MDVHTFNNLFIKPHTTGTGMGVGLNLHLPGKDAMGTVIPGTTKPKVLLSHAWNEDIEQVVEMVNTAIKKQQITFHDGTKMTKDTPVWFCPFSIFQGKNMGDYIFYL